MFATYVAGAGLRTPGAGATFTRVVIVAEVGRNDELSRRCRRLRSSINQATPTASAKVLGGLILTSNLISSFNTAMKLLIRNPPASHQFDGKVFRTNPDKRLQWWFVGAV